MSGNSSMKLAYQAGLDLATVLCELGFGDAIMRDRLGNGTAPARGTVVYTNTTARATRAGANQGTAEASGGA